MGENRMNRNLDLSLLSALAIGIIRLFFEKNNEFLILGIIPFAFLILGVTELFMKGSEVKVMKNE